MSVCTQIALLLEQDKKSGMSVREICRKAKIPIASYYNYIQGDTVPDMNTVRRLAERYSLPMSYFYEDFHPDQLVIDTTEPELTNEEREILNLFRESKSAKISFRELLRMTDEERLDWVITSQENMRKR